MCRGSYAAVHEQSAIQLEPWYQLRRIFTEVRGIGVLRTSPFGDSPKFAKKVVINTAIE
jgi:hypothetical protein